MLNFSQGELATLSAYATLMLLLVGVPYWLAILIAMALSAILGAVLERVVVRRLEGGSEVTLLTLGVALLLGINSIMAIIWTTDPRAFPSPFGQGIVSFAGLRM